MDVGINYPWQSYDSYGADFGYIPGWPPSEKNPNRREWQALSKNNKTILDENLLLFERLGIKIVRWFILGDGLSYGIDFSPDNSPDKKEAPQYDRPRLSLLPPQWKFNPSVPLAQGFEKDFEDLLKRFHSFNKIREEQNKKQNQIKLLPSLIDFTCFQQNDKTTPYYNGGYTIVKGRRYAPINDSDVGRTDEFLKRTLDLLLRISKKYPNEIYAWELINEPEFVTQLKPPKMPDDITKQTIPLECMRRFIKEGVKRIKNAGFISTVGFAHYTTLTSQEWNVADLGIDRLQFHYYGRLDGKTLANLPQMEKNVFLGEIGTKIIAEEQWLELAKSDTVYQRLCLAQKKGYKTVLLWSARMDKDSTKRDERTDWSDKVQKQVQQFTQGKPPCPR